MQDLCVRLLCVLQNEADAYRKMLLRVEEVQGKFCLTNFWVSCNAHIYRLSHLDTLSGHKPLTMRAMAGHGLHTGQAPVACAQVADPD